LRRPIDRLSSQKILPKVNTMEMEIIDLNRKAVAKELAKVLADETILYAKTQNAHWHIEGLEFYDKHKFFELQFLQLDDMMDSLEQRIRSIDHCALLLLNSDLNLIGKKRCQKTSQGFIQELVANHESIILNLNGQVKSFSEDYQDLGTSHFITDLMETHEKLAWFLGSHLNHFSKNPIYIS